MTFCLTGTLKRPRKEVQQSIKAAGGKVVGSVSSNLSVLIAGEKAGSKLSKAESLGITIWTEEQFDVQINQSNSDSLPPADDVEQRIDKKRKQPSLFDFNET